MARMSINVKLATGETISLDTEPMEPVLVLMGRINYEVGIMSYQQLLKIKGRRMDPEKLVADYNIKSGDTIHSTDIMDSISLPRSSAGAGSKEMQIFVKTLTGKTLTLNVQSSDGVETVMDKVLEEYEVDMGPGYKVKLTFAGKQLETGRALSYYDIVQGSTIEVKEAIFSQG